MTCGKITKKVNIKIVLFIIFINMVAIISGWQTLKTLISNYYWQKGVLSANKSNWNTSIYNYKKAIKLDPLNGRLRFFYGSMLLNAGFINEGIDELTESLNSFKDIYLYENIGKAFLEKEMFPQSIHYYRKAVETWIHHSDNLNNLGVAYLNSNRLDEAVKIFKDAIAIDHDHMLSHKNLGVVYLKKEMYWQAIEQFEKVITMEPDNINVLSDLGIVYIKLKEYDNAISRFQEILDLDPDNIKTYNNLGSVYYLKGNTARALKYWQKTLEIDSTNAIAKHNIKKIKNRNQ